MKQITFCLVVVSFFTVNLGHAQLTIQGYVDNYDMPLENVNINIKGTDQGTTTRKDGAFSLEAYNGDVLVFSYVGYDTVERTVENETQLLVSLNRKHWRKS